MTTRQTTSSHPCISCISVAYTNLALIHSKSLPANELMKATRHKSMNWSSGTIGKRHITLHIMRREGAILQFVPNHPRTITR